MSFFFELYHLLFGTDVTAVIHLSRMGKREVARTAPACLFNLLSAGGAGVITVATVALKQWATRNGQDHGFLAALLVIAVFAASFLLMQALGFRLATKQSPLLGAAMGRRWRVLHAAWRGGYYHRRRRGGTKRWRWPGWRRELLFSLRTQGLSAAGNLAFVLSATFAFHWLFEAVAGKPFLPADAALAALRSLHPGRTATLAYAALTGALLWFCTYLGGRLASRDRGFSSTAATAIFNVALAAALALVPTVAHWAGVPLDVRHFTLSGGTVALATASLGLNAALHSGLLLPAAFGVLAIGTLNFAVSFALGFVAAGFAAFPPAPPILQGTVTAMASSSPRLSFAR